MDRFFPQAMLLLCYVASSVMIPDVVAQIPRPDDAPPPLSVEESAADFRLPPGYRIELVASEPLVREPSGVCWDEQGRLFVCELHGYNLEGQYDIEELNKTGRLDREVRRIQADDRHKQAAEEKTYGTVKLLLDSDGDGQVDEARVFADRLPPCYGICPARGGIIVACAPDIVYLADRDGNGEAEIREILFTGFGVGALERGVNAPQWGPDDWIYFGRGHGGGRITGPHLAEPVDLPNTDFRIKSDGSALEPIPGGTHTIGFTFTPDGERFVTSTQSPAIQIAPIPWRYLDRNPSAAFSGIEHNTAPYNTVFPASHPHPWRTRRADDPGFAKYYTDRYGTTESTPNGFFTSACSPLVYQDALMPELTGHLLCCEPAQNLVHRTTLVRDGLRFGLLRAAGEEQAEFLTSTDPWFHPIFLTHAPDGSVWIVDFYREIIEDYSAIPRYLQQQYGLVNGREHGRIWRLTTDEAGPAPAVNLGNMSSAQLVAELAGSTLWRRQTARRLLVERQALEQSTALAALLTSSDRPEIALNVLHTLDALDALEFAHVAPLTAHTAPSVRVHALRACERWLSGQPAFVERALELARDSQAEVRLQAALTLGEIRDDRVAGALASLVVEPNADPWLHHAVLTAAAGRGSRLLAELLSLDRRSTNSSSFDIGPFWESLATAIAAERDPAELSSALVSIAGATHASVQQTCLNGLLGPLQDVAERLPLDDAARRALKSLAANPDRQVRQMSQELIAALQVETDEDRRARLELAVKDLNDVLVGVDRRLAAVSEIARHSDPTATQALIEAFPTATPLVRDEILDALFARQDRLPPVMAAIESTLLPPSALSAGQRRALSEHTDQDIRARAALHLVANRVPKDATFQRFAAGLKSPGDAEQGGEVFRAKCAVCHRAHDIGAAVGPDLSAEFRRSPETILLDILAPNDAIAAGYASYVVETVHGRIFTGVLASESANGLTLRLADGKEQVILRKDIERLQATSVSLMPENLVDSLQPQDVADVIAWLSQPSEWLVLMDEDPAFAERLTEGSGTAEMDFRESFSGRASLRVTPLQRHAARLPGWSYHIREHPGPGEYRFLRFAWKATEASGVMIELASDGSWPDAKSPQFRYDAGENSTGWQSQRISSESPQDWVVVTRDLWKDCGDCTITGIAPTAMGGPAFFDGILLLRSLRETDDADTGTPKRP